MSSVVCRGVIPPQFVAWGRTLQIALILVSALGLCACEGELSGFVGGGGQVSAGGTDGGEAGTANGAAGSGGAPMTNDGGGLTAQETFGALCAACHGGEGQGSPLGPELQHSVPGYATWVVRNGRVSETYAGPMLAFDESMVRNEQLEEIWAWLASQEQPATGEGLYQDYCANCHGSDALGGRVRKPIADKEPGDIQEKVREGEGGHDYANAEYMPSWSGTDLSDQEIALIAEYVASL